MREKKHSEDFLDKDSRNLWWNDDFLALMAGRLGLGGCTSMADIGCGTGYLGFRLRPLCAPGCTLAGIDREPAWVLAARQKAAFLDEEARVAGAVAAPARWRFEVGDATALPFDDASFDLTVCQTLLIHLADPGAAIREMRRVTKPGGLVVAFEPNNAAGNLVFDSVANPDVLGPERTLRNLEASLRIEWGKKALGEGWNSLGDMVPALFAGAGLSGVRVWLDDKAIAIVPPYTEEARTMLADMAAWIREGGAADDHDANLRWFLAGGGTRPAFDAYWTDHLGQNDRLLGAIAAGTYTAPGASLMYVVAGRR